MRCRVETNVGRVPSLLALRADPIPTPTFEAMIARGVAIERKAAPRGRASAKCFSFNRHTLMRSVSKCSKRARPLKIIDMNRQRMYCALAFQATVDEEDSRKRRSRVLAPHVRLHI